MWSLKLGAFLVSARATMFVHNCAVSAKLHIVLRAVLVLVKPHASSCHVGQGICRFSASSAAPSRTTGWPRRRRPCELWYSPWPCVGTRVLVFHSHSFLTHKHSQSSSYRALLEPQDTESARAVCSLYVQGPWGSLACEGRGVGSIGWCRTWKMSAEAVLFLIMWSICKVEDGLSHAGRFRRAVFPSRRFRRRLFRHGYTVLRLGQ